MSCWSSSIGTPENGSSTGRREAEKVLLMTRDFEVLSEVSLRTDSFGEDEAVDVGWGSKATQFHGSEGKAGALQQLQPPQRQRKARPTLEGRGYLTTTGYHASAGVETVPSSLSARWTSFRCCLRRQCHDRADMASHHPCILANGCIVGDIRSLGKRHLSDARIPSHRQPHRKHTKIRAVRHRRADVESGSKGRHDVVFFERNGLRHGEFSLREESASQPEARSWAGPTHRPKHPGTRTHYVRELAWNADGSALAVAHPSCGRIGSSRIRPRRGPGLYHRQLPLVSQARIRSLGRQRQCRASQVALGGSHCSLRLLTRTGSNSESSPTRRSPRQGRPPVDVACVAVQTALRHY